jgi:hypothetical protein
MATEATVADFEVKELVVFKVDGANKELAQKFMVVNKTTDKVVISNRGKKYKVYPFELYTKDEYLDLLK